MRRKCLPRDGEWTPRHHPRYTHTCSHRPTQPGPRLAAQVFSPSWNLKHLQAMSPRRPRGSRACPSCKRCHTPCSALPRLPPSAASAAAEPGRQEPRAGPALPPQPCERTGATWPLSHKGQKARAQRRVPSERTRLHQSDLNRMVGINTALYLSFHYGISKNSELAEP